MKIRSISCFYDPSARYALRTLGQLGKFARAARQRFESAGFAVQTTRLAAPPFPRLAPTCCDQSAIQLAQTLEAQAAAEGFDYLSLGPALPEYPQSYALIPEMIAATRQVFFGGLLTAAGQGVNLPAVRACAEVITRAASITPDGFANLRFAALANVPAGGPFFPAGYAAPGAGPAFALALETADEAQAAFAAAPDLPAALASLMTRLNAAAAELAALSAGLAQEYGLDFTGLDASTAPHPRPDCSIGAALERLGGAPLGCAGSLAGAAQLAAALGAGRWPHVGFNGLMLPVLEDATLAARAAEGSLTVKDLLMFSAVCGAGLDTLPLPGDTPTDALAALLFDVAALAVRLNKPLTARLMPIPGQRAGDPTAFQFDYFANSRVMRLDAPATPGLSAPGWVDIERLKFEI